MSGTPGRATRRRPAIARWLIIGGGVIVLAILAVVVFDGDDDRPAEVVRSPGAQEGPAEPTRLVLAVTGGAEPLVAVIGSGGDLDPAALVLPADLTMVVPGAGEMTVRDQAALPLDEMQMGLSNGVGAWAAEAARIDLRALVAALGDRALEVNLPAPATVGGVAVGPGPVSLEPAQVDDLLTADADDAHLRWQAALTALLAEPERLAAPTEATDPDAVQTIVLGARGATPIMAPTELIAATLTVPAQPRFDRTVGQLFGTETPVPVEVLNGSGEPGQGSDVGFAIVPLGYRVILSGNAPDFDVRRTEVVANGVEAQPDAQAVRDALGTGSVRVSQVASGIADVTVVTGADLS